MDSTPDSGTLSSPCTTTTTTDHQRKPYSILTKNRVAGMESILRESLRDTPYLDSVPDMMKNILALFQSSPEETTAEKKARAAAIAAAAEASRQRKAALEARKALRQEATPQIPI
jgi:hypothetical protein